MLIARTVGVNLGSREKRPSINSLHFLLHYLQNDREPELQLLCGFSVSQTFSVRLGLVWPCKSSQGAAKPTTTNNESSGSEEMFRNTFQSGFLSIFYSLGSKPLDLWAEKGLV